jgi:hypothetical protein
MSWKNRQLGSTKAICVCAATALTGTPNAGAAGAPFNQTVGLIQGFKVSEWVSTGEVWRPLGINVLSTTTFTVTAPVYQLQKGSSAAVTVTYVAPTSGGSVTQTGLLAAGSAIYLPWSAGTVITTNNAPYTFAAADAAGDVWSVKVTTSPTAGNATISLHYVCIDVAGISDAVTTL